MQIFLYNKARVNIMNLILECLNQLIYMLYRKPELHNIKYWKCVRNKSHYGGRRTPNS